MKKDRMEIAKKLGLNIKAQSETPGIYIKTKTGKRKLKIEEVFPELEDLKHPPSNKEK